MANRERALAIKLGRDLHTSNGRQGQEDPGDHQPASLTEMVNAMVRDLTQKLRWRELENT